MKKTILLFMLAASVLTLNSQQSAVSRRINTYDWEIKSGNYYSNPSRILLNGDNTDGGSILLETGTYGYGSEDGNIELYAKRNGNVIIKKDDGYIDIGPKNQYFAHIYTDLPKFIFNKPVYSMNGFYSHNNHLNLEAASDCYVNIKPRSSTYGLIIREYNSSDFGNIEVTSRGLGIGYKTSGSHMVICPNGNISIGTTVQKAAKLYVAGKTDIVGNFNGDMHSIVNHYANLPSSTDLIWGTYTGSQPNNPRLMSLTSGNNFRFAVRNNGQVGINCDPGSSNYMLTVNGKIKAEKIVVVNEAAPDYVFERDYNLLSINEVEKFISENSHLPDVPSAQDMINNGCDLVEMNNILLKKVEELTLYIIELKKENESIKEIISKLE